MDLIKKQKIDQIRIPDRPFSIQNNSFCFLPGNPSQAKNEENGIIAAIQGILKKYGRLYYLLVKIFSPVMTTSVYKSQFKNLLSKNNSAKIIINLGSGPEILCGRKDIINIDVFAFNEVDMVADATYLPIKDESVDVIINIAMLEHVLYPEKIIQEMHRILKNGGEFFCYLPFTQAFHSAPDDLYRWTIKGVRHIFSIFKKNEIAIGAGPTSGMLWVLQEWIAILFSFGSRTIHDFLLLLFMVVSAPIKLLDFLLVHFPYAEKIASGFLITGKK